VPDTKKLRARAWQRRRRRWLTRVRMGVRVGVHNHCVYCALRSWNWMRLKGTWMLPWGCDRGSFLFYVIENRSNSVLAWSTNKQPTSTPPPRLFSFATRTCTRCALFLSLGSFQTWATNKHESLSESSFGGQGGQGGLKTRRRVYWRPTTPIEEHARQVRCAMGQLRWGRHGMTA